MTTPVKHLRSATANKRPAASGMTDGRLAINTASGTPGLYFVNNASGVVKVGPAHVGAAAPNATPAGSAGNSLGELWVNNSTTINGLNYFTGSAFVNLTPSGTTAVAGLVELATDAETQTGTDTVRAVTPSGLQSKVSNSISTTSSTTIASATAVKTAYDLANAALPKAGGRITGNLEIGPVGSLSFEGSSDDSFETTLAVVNPTADRTITFPNATGTVVTTGDSNTVTGTMIAATTITNAEISASAAIALSKLATGALPSAITVASANIVDGSIVNADINASAAIADTKLGTISTAGKVNGSAITSGNINTTGTIQSPTLRTSSFASVATAGTEAGFIASTTSIQVSRDANTCGFFRRTTSNGTLLDFRRDTVNVGTISVTTTATAYNTSSDYRLKENVLPLTGAIGRIQQIPVHRFNFIAEPDTIVDGFLAHEAQEIVPECVTGTKDAVDDKGSPVYQCIDPSKLVPLLTAALQEALQKIEDLEGRLTAAGL